MVFLDFTITDKPKTEQEQILSKIQLKSIEKECLDRVFNRLCDLEEEPSSDEDSKRKCYLNEIEKKANLKKMKLVLTSNKMLKNLSYKNEKRFKDEDSKLNSINAKNQNEDDIKKKIGVKSIRKIIRYLKQEIPREEMELMIWVLLNIFEIFLGS